MGQGQSDENFAGDDGDVQQQGTTKKQRKQALRNKFYASGASNNTNGNNSANANPPVSVSKGSKGNIANYSSSTSGAATPWAFVKGSPPLELLRIPAQAPKRFTTRANAGAVDTNMATNVFPCFRGGGLLFRIEDPRDAGWWFYNDTGDMEMHVEYHFGPGSELDAGEHVVVGPSALPGQEGWIAASMIVFPGETLPFVSGFSKIRGFRSVFRIAPLSEQVAQRRAAEITAVVSKMSNEMEVVAKLNCDVAGQNGYTCLIEDAIVDRCARQQVPFVDLNFPPTADSMYGTSQHQQIVFNTASSKKNSNINNSTSVTGNNNNNNENFDPHSPHRRVSVILGSSNGNNKTTPFATPLFDLSMNNNNTTPNVNKTTSGDQPSSPSASPLSPLSVSSIAAEVAGGSKYVSEYGSSDTQLTAQIESDARDLHRRLPPTVWMRPKQFLLSGSDGGGIGVSLGQIFLRQQQQQAAKKNNKNNSNDNGGGGGGIHGDDDDYHFIEQQLAAMETSTDATVSCLTRGVRPSDIELGFLGDHWLQSAVSCVAEFPEVIHWIFKDSKPLKIISPSTNNNNNINALASERAAVLDGLTILKTPSQVVGAYKLCLNVAGWWTQILLDDYIPCIGNKPAFASSRRDRRELWPVLLQKAFAKVRGSYVGLVGGDPLLAMRTMTGCPTYRFDDEWHEAVRSSIDHNEPDEYFISTYLMENFVQGFMLCLNTKGIDATFSYDLSEGNQLHCQRVVNKFEAVGLQMGCCYSIVDMKYFPQWKLFLVKIRNPWLWTAGAAAGSSSPQQEQQQQNNNNKQNENGNTASGSNNASFSSSNLKLDATTGGKLTRSASGKTPATANTKGKPPLPSSTAKTASNNVNASSAAAPAAAVNSAAATTTTNSATSAHDNDFESTASTMTGTWNGNWGWASVMWDRFPEVAAACRPADCEREGDNFWMSWEDVVNYFDGGGVCFYRSPAISEQDLNERKFGLFAGPGIDTAALMSNANNNINNVNSSFASNASNFGAGQTISQQQHNNSSFTLSSAFNNLLTNSSNLVHSVPNQQKRKTKHNTKADLEGSETINVLGVSTEGSHGPTPPAISASTSHGNYGNSGKINNNNSSISGNENNATQQPNVMQTLSAVSFLDSSGTSSPATNTIHAKRQNNNNNNNNTNSPSPSQQPQSQPQEPSRCGSALLLHQPKPLLDHRVLGQFIDSLSSVCLEVTVLRRSTFTFILSQADSIGSRAEPLAAMMLSIAAPTCMLPYSAESNEPNQQHRQQRPRPCPYTVQWNSTMNPLAPSEAFTFNFARDLSIVIELEPSPKNAPYLIIPRVFDAGVNKRYVLGMLNEELSSQDMKFVTNNNNINATTSENSNNNSNGHSYCAKFVQLNADSLFFSNRRNVTHLPYYCQQQSNDENNNENNNLALCGSTAMTLNRFFITSLSRPVKARYQVKKDREIINNDTMNNNNTQGSSFSSPFVNSHSNNTNNNNASFGSMNLLAGSGAALTASNKSMIFSEGLTATAKDDTETFDRGFVFESIGTDFKIPNNRTGTGMSRTSSRKL